MKPIAVRSTAVVQAPAGFVWDFLHVYANDLEWRSGLEKMAQTPPGPVRDGARVEETLRVLGRVVESVVEVADVARATPSPGGWPRVRRRTAAAR